MTSCLSDRALYALAERGGTAAERVHLAACDRCTERAARLARDLALIGGALRAPEPVRVARPHVTRVPWPVVAAAAAVAVVAVVVAVPRLRPQQAAEGDDLTAFAALSTDVFAQDEDTGGSASDVDVMEAAFDASGPCEWQPDGCADE